MLIHFPIVLWLVAILGDLVSLFLSKNWLRNMTITLYTLAAMGAFASYLSGEQAIDMVSMPMQAELTASKHSDWGHYTFYFFSAYALIRLFLFWKQWDKKKWLTIVLFVFGVVGMGIVGQTADLGGKLVYKYGVGIKK
jgi:uncharacterized membrane protein